MRIDVRCPVFHTEDEDRILLALNNFFVSSDLKYHPKERVVKTTAVNRNALDFIRNAIHSSRIIDAVRSSLLRNMIGLETRMLIDKQAAYSGKFRLVDDREEEPPLGAIEIYMSFADEKEFETFLNWFVPPTKEGRVIIN
jgi:predicted RNA binding protein with dsRBD fold (UPF0201 family)